MWGFAVLAGVVTATTLASAVSCALVTGLNGLEEVDCGRASPCGRDVETLDVGRREARADVHDAPPPEEVGVDRASDGTGPECAACGGATSPSCCGGLCVDLETDPNHCGACDNACGSGACGKAIKGWTSASWMANGSSSIGSGQFGAMTGIVTAATTNAAGTLVYANPVVVDAFTATFTFYIGGGMGEPDAGVLTGADGLAFMFETDGPTALGMYGGCLGVCGLHGYGVEFDTYDNFGCGEVNANHVSIDSLDPCGDASPPLPTTLTSNGTLPFTLSDETMHLAVVQLSKGALSVTIDGTSILSAFALPGFTAGTSYYFGFGGGTGGDTDFHEVGPDLTISFPTPRCL